MRVQTAHIAHIAWDNLAFLVYFVSIVRADDKGEIASENFMDFFVIEAA